MMDSAHTLIRTALISSVHGADTMCKCVRLYEAPLVLVYELHGNACGSVCGVCVSRCSSSHLDVVFNG